MKRCLSVFTCGLLLSGLLAIAPNVAIAEDALRIVTLGDSITKGVRTGVGREETFAFLLESALKEKGISAEVTNVGIGGERTDQALKRLDKVIALKPNLVTIMYGTNDSAVDPGQQDSRITADEYRSNLQAIIKQLRAADIVPLLMTSPRWGKEAQRNGVGEPYNIRLTKYVQVSREVARETKTPLVDNFKEWTAQEKSGVDIGAWTTDQCHPNPEGHQVIAATMLPVVLKAVESSRTN